MIFSRLVEGLQAVREASQSLTEFHRTLDVLRERVRVLEEARRTQAEFMVRELNGIDNVLAEYDQRLENIEEQTDLTTQETMRQQFERDYQSMISGMFPIPQIIDTTPVDRPVDRPAAPFTPTATFAPPSAMHSFTIPPPRLGPPSLQPPPPPPPPLPLRPAPRVLYPSQMHALDTPGNIPECYLDPDGNVDLNDDNAAHYIYLMNQPPFRPRHHRQNNGEEGEITHGLTPTTPAAPATPVHVIPRETPFTIPESVWTIPDYACGRTEETLPPPLR